MPYPKIGADDTPAAGTDYLDTGALQREESAAGGGGSIFGSILK